MKRRAFIKSGLIFVPAIVASRKSVAQPLSLQDPAFVSLTKPASGRDSSGNSSDYTGKLFAYYKLEESSGTAADELSNAHPLNNHSGTPATTTGEIGTAYNMASWDVYSNSTDFNFSGHSFAVRFWHKFSSDIANINYIVSRVDDPNGIGWYLSLTDQGGGNFKYAFNLGDFVNFGGIGSTSLSATATQSTWHHIFLWHITGTGLRMKVDNGSLLSGTWTHGETSISQPFGLNLVDVHTFFTGVDELAVWKDYTPTNNDITYDYNAGAGTGYPLV